MVTIELRPDGEGIPVTEENKAEYVDAVVHYRISKRVQDQFESFMSGFNELVPQGLIEVFDERELEREAEEVRVHDVRVRARRRRRRDGDGGRGGVRGGEETEGVQDSVGPRSGGPR